MTVESPEVRMMAHFELFSKDKKENDVNLINNFKMKLITLFCRSHEKVSLSDSSVLFVKPWPNDA